MVELPPRIFTAHSSLRAKSKRLFWPHKLRKSSSSTLAHLLRLLACPGYSCFVLALCAHSHLASCRFKPCPSRIHVRRWQPLSPALLRFLCVLCISLFAGGFQSVLSYLKFSPSPLPATQAAKLCKVIAFNCAALATTIWFWRKLTL